MFEEYHKKAEFLENIGNFSKTIQPDFHTYPKRMRFLLNHFGSPHKNIKVIHVAGTSGKSSVARSIQSILTQSGKNTGLIVSPRVSVTVERIMIRNKYISPKDFVKLVDYVTPKIERLGERGKYFSFLEVIILIAFLYFKQEKVRWLVLETGVGGKYDHTNFIKTPVATVITNVGYDHTDLLGKTLTKIAREKAGVIKRNSTFYTSEKRPHILKIFKETCRKLRVPINIINPDLTNKNLVTKLCKDLGVSSRDIEVGIVKSFLPARFEIMQKNPTVILDGAHNVSKIQNTLDRVKKIKYRRLFCILGLSANKDIKGVLKEFRQVDPDYIIFTKFIAPKSCSNPHELNNMWKGKSEVKLDPEEAVRKILKKANKNDLVLITGSFFLAGNLRSMWYSDQFVLKNRRSL
jgi:dihydrofolate synthase/folylpolyglutamate synthase